MNTFFRHSAIVAAGLTFVLALPASLHAQAGISWTDPYAKKLENTARNSPFDNGTLGSQSALGQLEEMTGSTVDRSSTQTTAPRPVQPPKPRLTTDQQIGVMVTGMLLEAVFADIFADNSAQERAAAEAAAARAAAEAEAFRVQQELARKARIQMAQRYRAEWDDRETTIENQLSGAFDVHAGTAFFGMRANPDAEDIAAILGQDLSGPGSAADGASDPLAGDPSVVDLRGSSLVVPLLRPSAGPASLPSGRSVRGLGTRWAYELADGGEGMSTERSAEHARALGGFVGGYLRDTYADDLPERYVTAAAWNALKNVPKIDRIKALYDFGSKALELREEIGGWYGGLIDTGMGGATRAATVLGSRTGNASAYASAYDDAVARETGGLQAKIYKLVHGEIVDHFEVELESLEPVQGDSNVVPLTGVPDAYSLHMRLSLLGSGHR